MKGACMAASPQTVIHRRVDVLRKGEDPAFIARMNTGWVVLADPQVIPGYCLLFPDPVVPHLNALQPAEQQAFLADMAAVGDVLLHACGASRINYAIYGNVEPALHAHVFPRRADEPDALRMAQPWAHDWAAAPGFLMDLHNTLVERLRSAFLAMTSRKN
jgi:hypothetical protein